MLFFYCNKSKIHAQSDAGEVDNYMVLLELVSLIEPTQNSNKYYLLLNLTIKVMEANAPVIVSQSEKHPGLIMISPNNPESGAIMLRQTSITSNEKGFLKADRRVGFLKGSPDELQEILDTYNLQDGDNFSEKAWPLKLVIEESHDPFYVGQQPKINPRTGEEVTSEGAPVYRYTHTVPVGYDMQDTLLRNDRVTEAAEAAEVEPSTEFAKTK